VTQTGDFQALALRLGLSPIRRLHKPGIQCFPLGKVGRGQGGPDGPDFGYYWSSGIGPPFIVLRIMLWSDFDVIRSHSRQGKPGQRVNGTNKTDTAKDIQSRSGRIIFRRRCASVIATCPSRREAVPWDSVVIAAL
jgi:hypothetical protein